MPSDIFISYSSKDREKADQLTELLVSAGLSVWIDKSGIDIATSWSKEIVQGIDTCKAFIILLSPFSIESKNVVREVALAFEKNKKILPLELEPVTLSEDLQYHLAGIQRAPMTNIDAIIRTLGKFGLQATSAPTIKVVKETSGKKSLMILPFEDLSPTGDNGWFADGIVSELISALSNVKSLHLTDTKTTKDFKRYQGTLPNYAREMGIRYFVQGDVRKFGDQIKISTRLLDIETSDYLWQDSLKGTMQDIFDIQEAVAKSVVDGLKIILTKEEERKIEKKPTENAEAYELYLKGLEYHSRFTRADFDRSLGLYESAVGMDPEFADVHISIASTSLEYYRTYSKDEKWTKRASEHITKAEKLLGESAQIYSIRSTLARNTGNFEEARRLAERAVQLDSEYAPGHSSLGSALRSLGKREETAQARLREVQLEPNSRSAHFNFLVALNELGDSSRLMEAARNALPVYERHLRLSSDDLNARVQFAGILGMANKHDRSLEEARKLDNEDGLDPVALYNLACLYLHEGEKENALPVLRKSVERGLSNIETFRRDPDLDPLRGIPEFEDLVKKMEAQAVKD